MRRTTIKDIARAAGVSVGAASFALNDRPGVSDATRERVKRVAAELGWQRSAAAAALSARQAGALGIVLVRGPGYDYAETFVLRFMSGVHGVLGPLNQSLVFQLVASRDEEDETYRRWWGERRVDGVILLRPEEEDDRRNLLQELDMPGVVVGGPPSARMSSVSADELVTTQMLVDHFAELGHRHIAFVTGSERREYAHWRADAFRARAAEHGMESVVVHVDSEDEQVGLERSRELLAGPTRPTSVLYDNELLALGGLAACDDAGMVIGQDVCLASYEDAPALRMHRPDVTALRRRSETIGAMAARSLLSLVDGGPPTEQIAPLPDLVVRASSGHSLR